MMDPYVRIPLEHKGNGKYAVEFKLPDVYGIFDFKLQYSNVGYSSLEIIEPVTVHPFNHNEYPRFLFVAYPYYTAVALNMGAFFVFGLLFLFTKSESESVADKAKKEDGAVNAKAEGKSD
jgi:oligosaccharyltransferase complex subunit beta